MSVSKEQRAEWRELMTNRTWCGGQGTAMALQLLDALEQVEAERDALAEMHGRYIHCADVRKHGPCLEEQRRTGKKHDSAKCKLCWIEWAQQKAAGDNPIPGGIRRDLC